MRLGDLDALKEDFKSRLELCNEWIEKAKDEETKIRASAVKAYIAEVIMTIDNAPTVKPCENCDLYFKAMTKEEMKKGKWIKIFENPYVNGYVCSICGHKIQVTEQFLPKVTECEACGANMWKGGAE